MPYERTLEIKAKMRAAAVAAWQRPSARARYLSAFASASRDQGGVNNNHYRGFHAWITCAVCGTEKWTSHKAETCSKSCAGKLAWSRRPWNAKMQRMIAAGRARSSSIARTLVDVVLAEFPVVKEEQPFGPYRIDAYLPPPYHLAFEADGSYWHGLPGARERDERRDAHLLKRFKLPTVRLTEDELVSLR